MENEEPVFGDCAFRISIVDLNPEGTACDVPLDGNDDLNEEHEDQLHQLVAVRNGTAETDRDQRSQLHGLDQQNCKTKNHRKWVEKMPMGANHFVGRKKPRNDAGKEAHDSNEEEDSHGLISIEGSVTHLDEDVDQHPETNAGPEDGHGHHNERPGPADERLVGEDRKLFVLLIRHVGQNVLVAVGRVQVGLADGSAKNAPVRVDDERGGDRSRPLSHDIRRFEGR